jgi:hypothetical protein
MTANTLNLFDHQKTDPIQNLIILNHKPELTKELKSSETPILAIEEIPNDYYELISEALRKNNLRFAEILLNRIPFDVIFHKVRGYRDISSYKINWFDSKQTFNFLFERARKAKKIKDIQSLFANNNNLAHLCEYATLKQFKLISSKVRKNYWFLKDSWCLTNAITGNNFPIVKELIRISKTCSANSDYLIRKQMRVAQIYQWFLNDGADLRSLKLIKDEFEIDLSRVILDKFIESILSSFQYQNKDRNLLGGFKKIMQFFKIKNLNSYDGEGLLQKLMFNKDLFFFAYKKLGKNNIHYISERCFFSILHVKDSDVVVDPQIATFLLRKNISLLAKKMAK